MNDTGRAGRRGTGWPILVLGSAVAGAALTGLGLPAGFLLGPTIVAATLAMSVGGPVLSARAFDAAQAVIGLMIARTITWPILAEIGRDWPVFAAGVISVIAASLAIGWLLMRWQVLPGPTALWGTSPGAAVAMVLMSPAYGADERLVAFMQYLRVVIVATAASVLGAFAAPDTRAASGFAAWAEPLPVFPLLASLALCVGAYAVGRRLRMPAAPLIVAIVVGALAQDTGLVTITLPAPLLALSFTLIGWGIGLRFTRQTLTHALRALPAITGAILLLILICGGIAYLMVTLAGVDPLTAYLATSPGGADTVAIIASATHVDMAYVMAMQLARFLAVMVTGPPLARLMTRWAGYAPERAER